MLVLGGSRVYYCAVNHDFVDKNTVLLIVSNVFVGSGLSLTSPKEGRHTKPQFGNGWRRGRKKKRMEI